MKFSKLNLSTGKFALALILFISLAAVNCSKEEEQIQPADVLRPILLYHAVNGKVFSYQLNNGKDGLTKVLLYHVVDGRVYSSDLPAGPLSVKTLNGQSFVIDATRIKITDAAKRESFLIPNFLNIQATNGVIHVINRVILPVL